MAVTSPGGRTTSYRMDGDRVAGITRAGSGSENVTVGYANDRVASVATAAGTWSYGAPQDQNGVRTVTVATPANDVTTYAFDIASARLRSMALPDGTTTRWDYDALGRVTLATAPEGNAAQYGYDGRGNVTSTTVHAKPNSGLPDLTSSASYPASCGNAKTCNQPEWTLDAKGNETDYAYDLAHGGVTGVTLPAASAGEVRPEVRYGYVALTDYLGGTIWRPASVSACRTQASCARTADEVVTSTGYGLATSIICVLAVPHGCTSEEVQNGRTARFRHLQ